MRIGSLDLASMRAAWWTLRAAGRARRGLARPPLGANLGMPRVPRVGEEAGRGVAAVLRRREYSCLVQAAVRQAWLAAHDRHRDLIIGVTGPGQEFGAHAWLEGDPPCHQEGFHELLRLPGR